MAGSVRLQYSIADTIEVRLYTLGPKALLLHNPALWILSGGVRVHQRQVVGLIGPDAWEM